MVRNTYMAGLFAVFGMLGTPVLAWSPEWLDLGYQVLASEDRVVVQEEMARTGLYEGPVDGAFGEAVSEALAQLPDFLHTHTADRLEVVLDTPEDAARFLRELSEGAWSGFLYGTAGENAVH